MALTNFYLTSTKNLDKFLNTLITAQAPDRFTQKFLENLEFKSSSDRLFITLLKNLGMLDANGVPTERYYQFLDQGQSKAVLAEGIREAYGDLFAVNVKANELPVGEVKNKLRTLTQGKKSEDILRLMAMTFNALCLWADWTTNASTIVQSPEPAPSRQQEVINLVPERKNPGLSTLHYNIQIHLPETRDTAVYDAIFRSLKEHLL